MILTYFVTVYGYLKFANQFLFSLEFLALKLEN